MAIERRAITNRDEWLAWRKPNVNASAVGALFDCHDYTTALKLYAEQMGTEFVFEDTKVTRRGRWMEPAVAKAVEEMRPEWRLEPANVYISDNTLRLGCTPDFNIIGDPRGKGICQTKTVAPSVYERDWNGGAEVPLWIILQAATEAMLSDADFIVVAALLVDAFNMEVSIHEMQRNAAAEEKIKAAVREFWQMVAEGREPAPDFAKDADTIRAMWRREKNPDAEIDLSGNNRIPDLLDHRATLKDEIKTREASLDTIDAEIKFEMKDAAIATGLDGWRVTYRTSQFKEYTVKARETRVLRITDQRGKS